jgi:hypothetical protein
MRLILSTVLLGALGALMPACGSSHSDAAIEGPTTGVPGVDASIAFEHEGTLTIVPGHTTTVAVVGKPPAPYAVSFHLVGDAFDASLSDTDVVADANGRATVSLRAPSHATTFVLRATIEDGPSAQLPVAVSEKGFGTVAVVPVYQGTRPVELWQASVVTGKSCEALGPTFPQDPEGALTAEAEPTDKLWVEDVPVGPTLAVFVRAGHYMWGCADKSNVAAEATAEVQVPIVNKPIDATEARLDITLAFAPAPEPWTEILDSHLGLMIDTFTGSTGDEATALLAAMRAAAPDPSAFDQASEQHDWLALLAAHLGSNGADLTTALEQWAADGLAMQPPQIVGRVATMDESPGYASFTLDAIGNVPVGDAGVPSEYLMSLSVDPTDAVHLGGTLFFLPSRYLGACIDQAAVAGGASDVATALGTAASCGLLALQGLDGCDQACMTLLCETGLQLLWAQALDASAAAYAFGEIPMQASGGSSFDDDAALTGFEGTWLGEVLASQLAAKVSGAVVATESAPEPPAE